MAANHELIFLKPIFHEKIHVSPVIVNCTILSEILDNLIVSLHRHQNGQCIKGYITPNLRHFRKCR